MTVAEERIVTPEQAQGPWIGIESVPDWTDCLSTIATEPDRTRAAVIKVLRAVIDLARASGHDSWSAESVLEAVEDGAPL